MFGLGYKGFYRSVVLSFATLMMVPYSDESAASDGRPAGFDHHVAISSGKLAGSPADASGIVSFKGIPYAAPPVGNLRWKAPQPVPHWDGVRDATHFGHQCWAAKAFAGPAVANSSEDCLYLNVWSGAKSRSAKLPVMVWFHGGGFQFGSGSDPASDGTMLAKKGVVVVTLNYRLGVFGFLSRPDLDAESGGRKSGMYGIQDLIAALTWVKDNISQFGGDPDNVTVFGESAGSHAIGILMSSPLAKGLFHKAIGESGAFWESEIRPYGDAQATGVALGAQLNAPTLERLRQISAAELVDATDWNLEVATKFSPVVDGYVLPELPYLRFKNGRQNDVPLIAGWNMAEGSLFHGYSLPHDTAKAFTDAAAKKFGTENMKDFLQHYPASSAEQAAQSAEALVGDLSIKYETWTWALQQQKTGRSPVFVYNFSFTSPFTPVAGHVTEVAYVFGNFLPRPFHGKAAATAQDHAMSEAIQSYWTNFARTGNPNGPGLPQWPQFAGDETGQAIHLGNAIQAGAVEGKARFHFLDRFRVDGLITVGHH